MKCAECRHCLAKNGATMYNSGNSNKGEKTTMQNEDMQMIPYYVHESDMARMERQIKRLWIVLIMTIVFLVGSNAAWIYYESQFEDVTITAEQTADGDSNNYAIGGDYFGSTSEGNNQKAEP